MDNCLVTVKDNSLFGVRPHVWPTFWSTSRRDVENPSSPIDYFGVVLGGGQDSGFASRAGNPLNSLSFYNTSREYHQTREGSTLSSTCSRCRQRAYFLLAVTGFLAGAALPLLEAGEVATLLAGTTVLALGLYGFAVVDFFAVGYFLAEAGVLFDA